MADPVTIRTSTRVINGITTRIEVNTETGAATLYQERALGRTVLATGSAIGDKWTVTKEFASLYSTRVGSTLTLAQAQNAFSKDFQNLSNNDRASLINKWSADNTKTYLATTAKVPGIIDPKTELKTGQTTQTQATAPAAQPPGAQPPLSPDPSADPSSGGGTDPQTSIEPFSGAELIAYTNKQGFFADSKAILKYPLNQPSEVYDYIKIQPVEYVAGFEIGQDPTVQIKSVKGRIKNTGIYPTIFLPMSPNISEANSVGWGADELSPVQAAFGQAAMTAINGLGANPTFDALKDALGNITGTAINLANQPGLSKFISAYFAGQAVGTNLLGRTGIVINPNLELLFQGPKLRSFRYNFRFTPRDDKEAKEIRRIIRVFKKSMAVRRTEGSLFLGVPAVYEINYIFKGGGDHPFLNKIKPCALTGFNVNYAPDGSYMTYQDGSMTSYTVDMQFDELEPIYNEDISQDLESETMDY